MPTIFVDPIDFQELYGAPIDQKRFGELIDLVKGELKGVEEGGRYRVELNDTNRPDLWSAEGIARQLRAVSGKRKDYPFFNSKPNGEIVVDEGLASIRPYVAAFVARGIRVSERSLAQLIQTQEKLAENFGRRRKDVAIGVYNLRKLSFPVRYHAVDPASQRYTPLGCDAPMTLQEILMRHPKGIEYGGILAGCERVPLLQDNNGLILSMPPIINSRELGEVVPGDTDLFIEATGTKLNSVVLALNILACDLADRGARIERVQTSYPTDTPLGRQVTVPLVLKQDLTLPLSEFSRLLGIAIKPIEIDHVLERYGCEVKADGERIHVQPPPTRLDYLHPVDVIEDFAIARGFQTFEPRMPQDFSIGRSSPLSLLENKVRDTWIGLGYEELISNILVAKSDWRERMGLSEPPLVEISNVMNENFNCLRDSLLPNLLKSEAQSATAAYPHRLFESGEVALFDRSANHGSRTRLHLAALVAQRTASLAELSSDVEFLLTQLKLELDLSEIDHPWFLAGRAGRICAKGLPIGLLGEVHPEILTRWQIGMPVSAVELDLTLLLPE